MTEPSSSSSTTSPSGTSPAQELHLRENDDDGKNVPRVKPPPEPTAVPVPFEYEHSKDGTDENLLILLHGLGDTQKPFAKLGRSLKLPQAAILALRAPQQIPFLEEGYYQWYPSFDDLGQPIVHPNPEPATALLLSLIAHLTTACAWPHSRIHIFGFAQGGSVALETALSLWKSRPRDLRPGFSEASSLRVGALGSVVSIGGPVLVHHAITQACPTPVLVEGRKKGNALCIDEGMVNSVRKLFSCARVGVLQGEGEGMPASQEEWTPIMEFWSERLSKRMGEGTYEVVSKTA